MRIRLCVIFLLAAYAGYSQSDTLTLVDLSPAWISVNSNGELEGFVLGKSKEIFFDLPEDTVGDVLLVMKSLHPIDVWINGQLVNARFVGQSSWSLDSLNAVYSDSVRVALFADSGITALETVLAQVFYGRVATTSPMPRHPTLLVDAYLFITSLLIILAGLYKRLFPFTFSKSFGNPLTFKVRSLSTEESYLGFGSMDNIFSIIFLSSVTSLLLIYLELYPIGLLAGGAFSSVLAFWIMVVLIVGLVIFAKYVFSRTIALIFDFKGLANIQTQDFIHLSVLVVSAFLLLSLFDLNRVEFQSLKLQSIIRYSLVVSILFFQFWIFLKVDKFYSHRKLMIFIYLCTTEFLPGFLIIYWLVG